MEVALLDEGDLPALRPEWGQRCKLFLLNATQDFIHPGLPSSFRFLANSAPRAHHTLRLPGIPPVNAGDVLHFESLAELSRGAKRLGVLRADVDNLGMAMQEGLLDAAAGLTPTLARQAALSSSLDLFFAGLLNHICTEFSQQWLAAASDNPPALDGGVFYILYAGGDDLFIVGPWDAVMLLAQRLQQEFEHYTGGNPNLTLSAGFVQAKARFPIQKFSELSGEMEKLAKDSGRNRYALFNEAITWQAPVTGFDSLLELAQDLQAEIDASRIPRGLVIDLGQVHRQHTINPRRKKTRKLQPMWTPRLHYTLARRLNKEALENFSPRLFQAMNSGLILIPVSIVSLITRKE